MNLQDKTKSNVVKLFTNTLTVFKPKEDISISEYADRYRILPPQASSEQGRWRTSRFPFTKEIMDSMGPDGFPYTVLMKGSQVAGTECLINAHFFYMEYKPQSMLTIQPTISTAEKYAKQRIGPAIEAMPAIRDMLVTGNKRTGSGGSTMLNKQYPGGVWMLGGANSAASLRSMPVGIVFADEVDAYPVDLDGEGCPLDLAVRRTTNYPKSRIAFISTPTDKSTSKIEPWFYSGTCNRLYVPCPHCDELMLFKWEYMTWDKDEFGNPAMPIHAYMVCPNCSGQIEDSHKTYMLQRYQWIPDNPEEKKVNSFHLPAFYSPAGFYSWNDVVYDWIKSQGDLSKRKVVINTVFGETWEDESFRVGWDALYERRETYDHEVPFKVKFLTAGVDVQRDRLEVEVVGWGSHYESWGISYKIFRGNPEGRDVWRELDAFLAKGFEHASGETMYIICTMIDAADGKTTNEVLKFTIDKHDRNIFSVRGVSGFDKPLISKPTTNNKLKAIVFNMGVDSLKDNTLYRLAKRQKGDGYCHFPRSSEYDEEFFKQLTAENKKHKFINGVRKYFWEKERERNEAFDIRNYNRAAVEYLGPDWEVLEPIFTNIHNSVNSQGATSYEEIDIYDEDLS